MILQGAEFFQLGTTKHRLLLTAVIFEGVQHFTGDAQHTAGSDPKAVFLHVSKVTVTGPLLYLC